MKPKTGILVVLAGAVALWAAVPLSPPPPPTPIAPAPLIPAASKVKLLLFTQASCAPCVALKSMLADPAIADTMASFALEEVTGKDKRFRQYKVTSTPTLIALTASGPQKYPNGGTLGELAAWLGKWETPKKVFQQAGNFEWHNPQPGYLNLWRDGKQLGCLTAVDGLYYRLHSDGKTFDEESTLPPFPSPLAGPWGPRQPGSSSGIVEAGYDGPDGRHVMVEFPVTWWKANVTSQGQGCCVFRSLDFASHWQSVPALWGFPEWLQSKHLSGGGYSQNVNERVTKICAERKVPEPLLLNVESADYTLLKLILSTGRLACVDYSGSDGIHYHGRIAHCVCVAYADDDYVCILDNNFPPDKCLWMPPAAFKQRWGGWQMALLAPRPPAPPHN